MKEYKDVKNLFEHSKIDRLPQSPILISGIIGRLDEETDIMNQYYLAGSDNFTISILPKDHCPSSKVSQLDRFIDKVVVMQAVPMPKGFNKLGLLEFTEIKTLEEK